MIRTTSQPKNISFIEKINDDKNKENINLLLSVCVVCMARHMVGLPSSFAARMTNAFYDKTVAQ